MKTQVVNLKRHWLDLDPRDEWYRQQCDDLDERYIVDVTSRNKNFEFIKQISPMYVGPVFTGEGYDAKIFELFWQCSKVYPCHEFFGEPNEDYFAWRKKMFAMANCRKDIMRHPYKELGYKASDCEFAVKYNIETHSYDKLNYIEARKQLYVAEFAKLIAYSKTMAYLQSLVDNGNKLALLNFDTTNFGDDVDIQKVLNDPNTKFGHGYVIKMLLDKTIYVENGKIIDTQNLLS